MAREIHTLSWCIRDEIDSPKPTIDREHVTAYTACTELTM